MRPDRSLTRMFFQVFQMSIRWNAFTYEKTKRGYVVKSKKWPFSIYMNRRWWCYNTFPFRLLWYIYWERAQNNAADFAGFNMPSIYILCALKGRKEFKLAFSIVGINSVLINKCVLQAGQHEHKNKTGRNTVQHSLCLRPRTVVTSEMTVVVVLCGGGASSKLVASAQWTNICHFALTYISMWLLQEIVLHGTNCTFKHLNNNLANFPSQCTQKTISPSIIHYPPGKVQVWGETLTDRARPERSNGHIWDNLLDLEYYMLAIECFFPFC